MPTDEVLDYVRSKIVIDDDGCWIWPHTAGNGYGRYNTRLFGLPPRPTDRSPPQGAAARDALSRSHVDLPPGLPYERYPLTVEFRHVVCGHLGKHACVNPDHGGWGSRQDNARDTVLDGRHKFALKPEVADYILRHPEMSAHALSLDFGIREERIHEMRRGKTYGYFPQPKLQGTLAQADIPEAERPGYAEASRQHRRIRQAAQRDGAPHRRPRRAQRRRRLGQSHRSRDIQHHDGGHRLSRSEVAEGPSSGAASMDRRGARR